MHACAPPHDGRRGTDLLVRHLSSLGRLEQARPPAYERLVAVVGDDLARLLVGALAGDAGARTARLYAA